MSDSKTNPNPTVIIVHGAWHPPPIYDSLVSRLRAKSYDAIVPSLPSCDSVDPANATCLKDTEVVRDAILPLLDSGRDVVLVAHSYGGVPAGGAARGLSPAHSERQDTEGRKKGAVLGLVYVSAMTVPEDSSLLAMMGGKHAPFVIVREPDEYNSLAADPQNVFFNDIIPTENDKSPSAHAYLDRLASLLRPQALLCFDSPAPSPAWTEPEFAGRLGFIKCMKDQCLPPPIQEGFTKHSGVDWEIKEIAAGHAPWEGKPDDFVGFLEEWIGKWKR